MRERPSIQLLENFIIYGRVQNFAVAALEAHITQSAFSFQMKKLEDIVGVSLIARSSRGSCLTKEGEFFLEKITPLLQELDTVIDEVKELNGQGAFLNVGMLMSMGDILMNRHIHYFQNQEQPICFNVYNLESREMLHKLQTGDIDVASAFLLPQMHLHGLDKTYFCTDELVCYAPCLTLPSTPLTLAEIASHPFVSHSPDYFMTNTLQDYFQEADVSLSLAVRLSTPYAIVHYCQANPASTLLPRRLLSALGITDGIYTLASPLYFDSYLFYRSENPKIETIRRFIEYICQYYEQESQ